MSKYVSECRRHGLRHCVDVVEAVLEMGDGDVKEDFFDVADVSGRWEFMVVERSE